MILRKTALFLPFSACGRPLGAFADNWNRSACVLAMVGPAGFLKSAFFSQRIIMFRRVTLAWENWTNAWGRAQVRKCAEDASIDGGLKSAGSQVERTGTDSDTRVLAYAGFQGLDEFLRVFSWRRKLL